MYAACITRFGTVVLVGAALAVAAAPARAAVQLPGGGTVQQGRFRAARHGPVRPHGLQLRLLPRLLPGQGRLPPVAVRLRPREGLRRPDPRRCRAGASTSPTPTAACCCSRPPARSSTAARRASARTPGSIGCFRDVDRRRRHRGTRAAATSQSVAVNPPEYAFAKPGQTGQLARRGDLRRWLQRKTSRRSATSAPTTTPSPRSTPLGQIKALRPGDTAVIVSYRGNVLPVRVLVPDRAGGRLPVSRRCPRSTTSTARSSPSCAG